MIYVMSDIHGHMARFRSVMKKIDLKPEDTLYVLGDVIDRNADGIRILRELMAMPNVKMTLGNHELMMLQALCYAEAEEAFSYIPPLYRWYNNGGLVTHEHLKHLRKTLRAEVFAYLDRLPVNIKISVRGERFVWLMQLRLRIIPCSTIAIIMSVNLRYGNGIVPESIEPKIIH